MAAPQARAAPDIAGCLSRRSKERTIGTSIVAGMHRLPNGSVLAAANGQNSATCQQRIQEDVFAAQPVYRRRLEQGQPEEQARLAPHGERPGVPVGQPSCRTERSRVANPSGSSANPVWPPGNIVGSAPSAVASALDARSQSWPAEASPMPTTIRGEARY